MIQISIKPSNKPGFTEVWWGEELTGVYHEKDDRETMIKVIRGLMKKQLPLNKTP